MKYIYTLFLVIMAFWGCQDVKIGCLDVSNAEYMPDTMLVRKELGVIQDDWNIVRQDRMRLKVKAPWVTNQIQGVIGTAPIQYSLYDVTRQTVGMLRSSKGIESAGWWYFRMPLSPESLMDDTGVFESGGRGYSAIIENVFTFVIRQR
ncbi:MAG: hypothetical protein ACLU4N_18180 [Butyricimonas faecihominis]